MRAFAVPYAMVLLCLSAVIFAQAVAPDRAAIVQTYANMCATQSVNMPTPFGESDLKDSPKLAPYWRSSPAAAEAIDRGGTRHA